MESVENSAKRQKLIHTVSQWTSEQLKDWLTHTVFNPQSESVINYQTLLESTEEHQENKFPWNEFQWNSPYDFMVESIAIYLDKKDKTQLRSVCLVNKYWNSRWKLVADLFSIRPFHELRKFVEKYLESDSLKRFFPSVQLNTVNVYWATQLWDFFETSFAKINEENSHSSVNLSPSDNQNLVEDNQNIDLGSSGSSDTQNINHSPSDNQNIDLTESIFDLDCETFCEIQSDFVYLMRSLSFQFESPCYDHSDCRSCDRRHCDFILNPNENDLLYVAYDAYLIDRSNMKRV